MNRLDRVSDSTTALRMAFSAVDRSIEFLIHPGGALSEYYFVSTVLKHKSGIDYRAVIQEEEIKGEGEFLPHYPRTAEEACYHMRLRGWDVRTLLTNDQLSPSNEILIFDQEEICVGQRGMDGTTVYHPPAILRGGKYDLRAANQIFTEYWVRAAEHTSDQEKPSFAIALVEGRLRGVLLTPDGNYKFLDEEINPHTILYTNWSAMSALQNSIAELEDLMNSTKSVEADFQSFFERNTDFLLSDSYKTAHPHIVLESEEIGVLIPDFVLEPVDQNCLCDLLELKLPSVQIFNLKKNRPRFSAAVLEARAQLMEYSRYFNEGKNREVVFRKYGLKAFMPKMLLVIGRLGSFDPIDRRKIEMGAPDLYLITYDQILSRMKRRLNASAE